MSPTSSNEVRLVLEQAPSSHVEFDDLLSGIGQFLSGACRDGAFQECRILFLKLGDRGEGGLTDNSDLKFRKTVDWLGSARLERYVDGGLEQRPLLMSVTYDAKRVTAVKCDSMGGKAVPQELVCLAANRAISGSRYLANLLWGRWSETVTVPTETLMVEMWPGRGNESRFSDFRELRLTPAVTAFQRLTGVDVAVDYEREGRGAKIVRVIFLIGAAPAWASEPCVTISQSSVDRSMPEVEKLSSPDADWFISCLASVMRDGVRIVRALDLIRGCASPRARPIIEWAYQRSLEGRWYAHEFIPSMLPGFLGATVSYFALKDGLQNFLDIGHHLQATRDGARLEASWGIPSKDGLDATARGRKAALMWSAIWIECGARSLAPLAEAIRSIPGTEAIVATDCIAAIDQIMRGQEIDLSCFGDVLMPTIQTLIDNRPESLVIALKNLSKTIPDFCGPQTALWLRTLDKISERVAKLAWEGGAGEPLTRRIGSVISSHAGDSLLRGPQNVVRFRAVSEYAARCVCWLAYTSKDDQDFEAYVAALEDFCGESSRGSYEALPIERDELGRILEYWKLCKRDRLKDGCAEVIALVSGLFGRGGGFDQIERAALRIAKLAVV